ncbi:uncharacterized protein EV420DRAFT_1653856 [Desarmillaria tabescens]|uniref:Uncharacterized protein n=1 Tax=Armillaria tabescens TaxID=1929756 RepID=A0AA39MIG7_ARMTA|nr:uncharacterized protein EV420DRAFT_1653856 [Desarmillaria tabescens]KAK0434675.1 hypothetical protein EV420DRAFT_1653856 [Desarmillaria tabescens]
MYLKAGFPGIAKLIIEASPDEALYTENGVGETPLEIASLEYLAWKMTYHGNQYSVASPELGNNVDMVPHHVPATLAKDLLKLCLMMADLVLTGKLTLGMLLADELDKFASLLETKLMEVSKTAKKTEDDINQVEGIDRYATFEKVIVAVIKWPGKCKFVHLLDVQRSVQSSLAKSRKLDEVSQSLRGVDELEPEVDTA